MLKLVSIAILSLLPVLCFAAETKEAKCNSAEDCFDKFWYLTYDKEDMVKSEKYVHKACAQYNHGPSCVFFVMYYKKPTFDEIMEVMKKAAKQNFPFALFMLRFEQDDFSEFKNYVNNNKLKQYFDSDARVNKMLNFSKDFYNICRKQKGLRDSKNLRERRYYHLSNLFIIAFLSNKKVDAFVKGFIKSDTKFMVKNKNVLSSFGWGLYGLQNDKCGDLEDAVELLEYYIEDKKKYDDL